MTAQDIEEFTAYLRNCTDAQLQGVYEKERKALRSDYAELTYAVAQARGVMIDDAF